MCPPAHRRGPDLGRAFGARGEGREQRGAWGARATELPDVPSGGEPAQGAGQPAKDTASSLSPP